MKVWTVHYEGWEDNYLEGIFSTKAKAEEYIKDKHYRYINEWEMDQPDEL